MVFENLLRFRIPVHAAGSIDQVPFSEHVASSCALCANGKYATRSLEHLYWKISPSVYVVGRSGTGSVPSPSSGGSQMATKWQLNSGYSQLFHICADKSKSNFF